METKPAEHKKQFKGALMLLVTSFIWGSAIVSQSVGMDSVGPFTFNTVRGILGMASILVYLLLRDAKHLKGRTYQETVYKLAAYGKQLRHSIKTAWSWVWCSFWLPPSSSTHFCIPRPARSALLPPCMW